MNQSRIIRWIYGEKEDLDQAKQDAHISRLPKHRIGNFVSLHIFGANHEKDVGTPQAFQAIKIRFP